MLILGHKHMGRISYVRDVQVDEDDLDDGLLDDDEVRDQALALMKQFDKDGEGMLDPQEMAQIKVVMAYIVMTPYTTSS